MTRKVILCCFLAWLFLSASETSKNEDMAAIFGVFALCCIGVAAHFALAPSKSGEDKS